MERRQGRQPARQGLGTEQGWHLPANSVHPNKELRSFLTLYKVAVGSSGLLKTDIGTDSEDGSMAGALCGCRHGSNGDTEATSPCHPLHLLLLTVGIQVQWLSDHRCRNREPCSSVRGEAVGQERGSCCPRKSP